MSAKKKPLFCKRSDLGSLPFVYFSVTRCSPDDIYLTTVWSTLVGVYLNVCMTLDVAIKHKTGVYVVLYQRER